MSRFNVTVLKGTHQMVLRVVQAHGEKKPRSRSLFQGQRRIVLPMQAAA